jgi:hypothetical protein
MARDEQAIQWFGDVPPIGEVAPEEAVARLREMGDDSTADELAAATRPGDGATFSLGILGGVFNRYIKTTHVCGFLPARGSDRIMPVTQAPADATLSGAPLKISLDGIHVAKYPGRGRHNLLFDFALQSQLPDDTAPVFHYNARFDARDGETVPVRSFPLFYGLVPSAEGITFGFQTINVSSSHDEGLLSFLGRDEFKRGLSLLGTLSPAVGQLSQMAASLTGWLAGQSRNAKVQEFRQGLDFSPTRVGGGLAEGTYVVAQIPRENQLEWSWDEWAVDPTLVRLVSRESRTTALDFNHLMFGVKRMED